MTYIISYFPIPPPFLGPQTVFPRHHFGPNTVIRISPISILPSTVKPPEIAWSHQAWTEKATLDQALLERALLNLDWLYLF